MAQHLTARPRATRHAHHDGGSRATCPEDLVFSSCGHLVQGTPDGGFRDAEGLLRLVQAGRLDVVG